MGACVCIVSSKEGEEGGTTEHPLLQVTDELISRNTHSESCFTYRSLCKTTPSHPWPHTPFPDTPRGGGHVYVFQAKKGKKGERLSTLLQLMDLSIVLFARRNITPTTPSPPWGYVYVLFQAKKGKKGERPSTLCSK
eukprot:TRINITY_DN16658_c0_g2_i1.p2 TRINITY_DN16658_c0_g2~~TRINITY_DN16658_c0_g2_i1.p2  ORF type:complete len:137 (+),score=0.16 TRINITY_DN16658_c0_g2_i1:101-511(+)